MNWSVLSCDAKVWVYCLSLGTSEEGQKLKTKSTLYLCVQILPRHREGSDNATINQTATSGILLSIGNTGTEISEGEWLCNIENKRNEKKEGKIENSILLPHPLHEMMSSHISFKTWKIKIAESAITISSTSPLFTITVSGRLSLDPEIARSWTKGYNGGKYITRKGNTHRRQTGFDWGYSYGGISGIRWLHKCNLGRGLDDNDKIISLHDLWDLTIPTKCLE